MLNHRLLAGRLVLSLIFLLLPLGSPVSAQYTLRIGIIDYPDGSTTLGARLAAQHVNDAGGIIGADGTVFQLAVVDTSPHNMDIAVANMRQTNAIAVIGPATSESIARNLSLLQSLDVPVLTPATADTLLLPDNTNRIFRSRAQESLQTRALTDYLVNILAVRSIRTVQLDTASTASLITLANALASFGVRPSNLLYDEARPNLEQIAGSVALAAPDVVTLHGPPKLAAQAYNRIRSAGFTGAIVYSGATDPDFVEIVPSDALEGIIGASTWSFGLDDGRSRDFTLAYARAFGRLPDSLSAASYDAVQLVADAVVGTGPLAQNIAAVGGLHGVQGELNPADLRRGETSTNVVVTRLNRYGTPLVVARYQGQRLGDLTPASVSQGTAVPTATATPVPTATPSDYTLTIQSAFQNIRSGPGLKYDVIGQILQGAQARVLGATDDYGWLVIDYRGQRGWLAAYLVDTFGNRNLVPIIQPPATPTPLPSSSLAPPQEPDLVVLHAHPPRITIGEPMVVNVTLLNQGLTSAGGFAIAGAFEPGGRYAGVNLPGLAAGQQATAQLSQTLDGPTGPQSVIIVVDLNGQVWEGAPGEANNRVYSYNYIADRAVLTSGAWTIAAGSIDLDGNANPDFSWTGNELIGLGGAGMVLMNHFSSIEDLHYDAIDRRLAMIKRLDADLLPNATIGLVTADGNRGVIRVTEAARGGTITIEYRVYR